MRIIINVMNTGVGNNGGSFNLTESANTLFDLGEDVVIIDTGASQYTWGKIKVPHIKVKDVNSITGDVIIGTGTKSIVHTNKSKIKNKYLWIRGWEIWNTPEDKLIKILKESKTKKIVNSICLQRKLSQYKIESTIVRPGHTFNDFLPLDIRKHNKSIILGGLYNEGKKRSKKRTEWIYRVYENLKSKYNIQLFMFGSDGIPKFYVDNYFKNPVIKIKNEIYNKVDIWLSPSELEGLHIPPAEAMLTKCCVAGNNSTLSGTEDYLINNETGLVSENNFDSFLNNVEVLIKNKELRKKFGENGRNKILSLGDRKENMLNLISILKENVK